MQIATYVPTSETKPEAKAKETLHLLREGLRLKPPSVILVS